MGIHMKKKKKKKKKPLGPYTEIWHCTATGHPGVL
jgi:hypothetical protein